MDVFYIGDLVHIISCHSDDKDDVLQRRCNFIGQANYVFLFFQDTGYVRFGSSKMMFFKTFVVRGEQLSGVY